MKHNAISSLCRDKKYLIQFFIGVDKLSQLCMPFYMLVFISQTSVTLLIQHHSPLHLHAFTDANWVGDKETWRSTTGNIVYLRCNPISEQLHQLLLKFSG